MGAQRKVPDKNTLARWIERGLTQQEMVEEIYRTTGERVTRAAVAQAVVRSNLGGPRMRYKEHIPWHVEQTHLLSYPVRMLRLLGRRDAGLPMKEGEAARLDSWLETLDRENAVVAYDPTSEDGFAYVPREAGDSTTIPIRVQTVKLSN